MDPQRGYWSIDECGWVNSAPPAPREPVEDTTTAEAAAAAG
jgi:hypothetical protein